MFLHHPLAGTACPWWKLARFDKVKQQIFFLQNCLDFYQGQVVLFETMFTDTECSLGQGDQIRLFLPIRLLIKVQWYFIYKN
jgi:hypothetical protein